MSSPRENESSHPLEQVTGEKDVHPEEEESARSRTAADAPAEDAGSADAGETPAQ
ncbi:hypothetical protein [Streptomyces sp. NPDC048521]|uniref:hypothetical protein n=1 Tax=Streptomyces sp. NPDC048521 TaxID=3365566 RepID=UPI003711472D